MSAKRKTLATCGTCRRVVPMRLDGLLSRHLSTGRRRCYGSNRPPESHGCNGCGDAWSETRTADAVDTVRWPGWLA